MENLKYASELPYPTIEVEKNVAESKLLMPSYSGSAGELTAILTYAFQSYITPRYPEIAKAMEGVAMVEMHHHELLGKTIYALGGYPVMGGRTWGNGNFATIRWTRKNISSKTSRRKRTQSSTTSARFST